MALSALLEHYLLGKVCVRLLLCFGDIQASFCPVDGSVEGWHLRFGVVQCGSWENARIGIMDMVQYAVAQHRDLWFQHEVVQRLGGGKHTFKSKKCCKQTR